MNNQFLVSDGIKVIPLSGEKLEKETTSLDKINGIGSSLFLKNKAFIREHVEDNWYAAVEPVSGNFIAADNQLALYQYTSKNYPNKIFYVIGLLKNNSVQYARTY